MAKWTKASFCCRSETKQSHTFRTSRETTTWIAVELSETYTIAKAVDVVVTFPPQFSHFRAGRDTGFSITKVKGNVFKEVLNWEVNSQVSARTVFHVCSSDLAHYYCLRMIY